MKNQILWLITHKYYGMLVTIVTKLAGLAFLWTSLSAWSMSHEVLFGFKTQLLTWILGTISNFVLALVLYVTNANKITLLTIIVWFIGMLNMTMVVLLR